MDKIGDIEIPPIVSAAVFIAETEKLIAPRLPTFALPVVSAKSLSGKPVPQRPWLVPDVIPSRTVTLLNGDGAAGKSTIAKQLGASVVTGKQWFGTSPEAGPVIFVSAEDDINELHRRLVAIAENLDVDLEDLADLHLVPLAGLDAVLGAPDGKTGIIAPTPVWRGLVDIVTRTKPCLVVLDTLADVFAGNENSRQDARQFIGLLRGLAIEHDLAVLLLAHPSLFGISSGAGTSGSTAWSNSVRSRLYLETLKGADGKELDADLRVLSVKKSNYGPPGLELRLRWSDGCFRLDSPANSYEKLAAEAKAERVFLELLATFEAQGRDVSAKPSRTYAPTVFAKHPDAAGVRKEALDAAMERLLSAKRIYVDNVGPPSKQRSRLVTGTSQEIEF